MLRSGGGFYFLFWGVCFVFLNTYTAGVLHSLTRDSNVFMGEGFKNVCWWLFFGVFQNKECE